MKTKANGAVKIESGIPVPSGGGRFGPYTEALKAMKKGDSFSFPDDQQVRNTLYQIARRIKLNITIRKTGDGKARLWRMK